MIPLRCAGAVDAASPAPFSRRRRTTPPSPPSSRRSAAAGVVKKIGAVEDLMREHGVIRRVLLVYRQTAARLRAGAKIDPKPIRQAAQLFRDFGENYHERMLEQAYIFPTLRKGESPVAALVPPLVAQHDRGRDITDLSTVTGKGAISDPSLRPRLETLDAVYGTMRRRTIVFPAWREALSEAAAQRWARPSRTSSTANSAGRFDDAVKHIAAVEETSASPISRVHRAGAPRPP
jgi:hypothetical protein